jgi:hypothetical protein
MMANITMINISTSESSSRLNHIPIQCLKLTIYAICPEDSADMALCMRISADTRLSELETMCRF